MTAVLIAAALLVPHGVDGSPWDAPIQATAPAVRVATTVQVAEPPPTLAPAERVPPGTHCTDLLEPFMAAGGEPENFSWYGNVAWGESHCRPDAHNGQLAGGTWGPMQISYGSWHRLCGLGSPHELYAPETTFRCAFAIEAAAGRRQWSPHNTVTGCFPRGVGVQC